MLATDIFLVLVLVSPFTVPISVNVTSFSVPFVVYVILLLANVPGITAVIVPPSILAVNSICNAVPNVKLSSSGTVVPSVVIVILASSTTGRGPAFSIFPINVPFASIVASYPSNTTIYVPSSLSNILSNFISKN